MTSRNRRRRGHQAETLACRYLMRQGLRPLSRNFHSRFGEIDLVMLDGETLVFVEVRYRKKEDRHGTAEATITAHKRARIVQAARWFLLRHPQHAHRPARFDVVCLTGPLALSGCFPRWHRNAFGVDT